MQHSFLETKIISIIIIYNAEKSISTSIRSIQNQNMTDIELLLIDDCSLDKSLKIIEKLQKEDKRIKIIKNKQNKGALFPRSLGALKSKGYIYYKNHINFLEIFKIVYSYSQILKIYY